MAKFCSKCGNQMPDNANVCSNCGTPLAAPVAPQYQAQGNSFGDMTKGLADKFLSLLTIVAIIFLAIGGTAFLYYFITAIVLAADASHQEFLVFLERFAVGIGATAKYAFFAIVTLIGSKLIKK